MKLIQVIITGVLAATPLAAALRAADQYRLTLQSSLPQMQASSGNGYTVTGGLDLAPLGTSSGAGFKVEGALVPATVTVSVSGGPVLSITTSGEGVTVSWSPQTPGYVLQRSSDLATGNWVLASTNGAAATFPLQGTSGYFRLIIQ